MAFLLRFGGQSMVLPIGELTVGRDEQCHLALEDPNVSRVHMSLLVSEDAVLVRDAGSRNGVWISGERIANAVFAEPGTSIRIGETDLMLERTSDAPEVQPKRRETLEFEIPNEVPVTSVGFEMVPSPPVARPTRSLLLVADLADKAMARGRADEAERIVEGTLKALLKETRQGVIERELMLRAAACAVQLAAAKARGRWVDYLFDLFVVPPMVLPAPVVDQLYELVRRLPDVDRRRLREYVRRLEENQTAMSATERFSVRRLGGLDAVVASAVPAGRSPSKSSNAGPRSKR